MAALPGAPGIARRRRSAAGLRRENAAGALQGKRGRENALGDAQKGEESGGASDTCRGSPELPESAKDGGGQSNFGEQICRPGGAIEGEERGETERKTRALRGWKRRHQWWLKSRGISGIEFPFNSGRNGGREKDGDVSLRQHFFFFLFLLF